MLQIFWCWTIPVWRGGVGAGNSTCLYTFSIHYWIGLLTSYLGTLVIGMSVSSSTEPSDLHPYCRGSGTKQARKSGASGTVWILIWSSYLWLGTSLPPSLLWCLPKPINSRLVSPETIPPNCGRAGRATGWRRGAKWPLFRLSLFIFKVNGSLVNNLWNVHVMG